MANVAKHVRVHGGDDGVVLARARLGREEDRIPLGNGNKQLVGVVRHDPDAIGFHHRDSVLIKLQIHASHGAHVDDVDEILLARRDGELHILTFIHECRIGNRFDAACHVGVVGREVVVDQLRRFLVVEIRQRECELGVGLIRRTGVLDDQWSSEAIDVLPPYMCVIPVSTRLEEAELVHEALSGGDGTLGYSDRAVLECGVLLEHAVEMDRCVLVAEAVDDVDLDGVSQRSGNWGIRPLSVDADKSSGESIRSGIDPGDVPVVRDDLPHRDGRSACSGWYHGARRRSGSGRCCRCGGDGRGRGRGGDAGG